MQPLHSELLRTPCYPFSPLISDTNLLSEMAIPVNYIVDPNALVCTCDHLHGACAYYRAGDQSSRAGRKACVARTTLGMYL